jgi:hypothetical protein
MEVDMLSTALEQGRLRQYNVLLDVGNTIKRKARGLHVSEGEKCFGLRPHQLQNDLLHMPAGLELVLAPYRRMALDLDTRVAQHWQNLQGRRLLEFGMRPVGPSGLRGCARCHLLLPPFVVMLLLLLPLLPLLARCMIGGG